MNILIKRFGGLFKGVISGFDRIVFKGMFRPLVYPEGAEGFFRRKGVLNKNYKAWVTEQSEGLVGALNQQGLERCGTPIVALRSWREDKEAIARKRQREKRIESGLIGMWSCLETGNSFRASYRPGAGRPSLAPYRVACKHVYLYFDHEDYGFMNIRLQTWFPFHIQICLNGREWMRRSLQKEGADFAMNGNKLLYAADFELVQRTLDLQLDTRWQKTLDGFLAIAFPTMRLTLNDGLSCYWTLWQSELATDFISDSPERLNAIAGQLLRHAFMTGTSERVLRYFNRPLNAKGLPYAGDSQICSRTLKFSEGLRVRHWIGNNSVKTYTEQNNLRVETTINQPGRFKVWRHAQGEKKTAPKQFRSLRKGVADVALRAKVSQEVNDRLILNLANMDDETPLRDILSPITVAGKQNGRRVRALDPTGKDVEPLRALSDAAFDINGVTNKQLREKLAVTSWGAGRSDKQLSAKVSRLLRLLRDHGIIRKNPIRRSYHLTQRGRQIIIAVCAMLSASTKKLMEIAA